MHSYPGAQGASIEQVETQLFPTHAYGAHRTAAGTGSTQCPNPSQVLALRWMAPEHIWGSHTTPDGVARHPPAPSHFPSRRQGMLGSTAQLARGSAPPSGTKVQKPRLPSRLHERHPPAQSVLQHTPSTQYPLRHSRPGFCGSVTLQASPSGFFFRQTPPSQ